MLQINQVLDSFFNKGFKAPKCKTLLKLATSRIKLLRNKRSIQLKQMRKELAQLLENGQEAIAQIRVEQIIREQNTMEAYDKLDIFCELLSVRLPIIESQRECPLDLHEAVATVMFAAPRASDVPELLEIQRMFSSKYGPEFTTAAAELLPDCNVNRMVIEMLSARAPSMKVKLKVMKEIADEHKVEWDATTFELENSKPPEDLLDGTHYELQNTELPAHVLDGTITESEISKKQEDLSGVTNHIIGPIQMLPIPYHGSSNKSELDSLPEEEFCLPSPPKGNLISQPQQSSSLVEEPQFVPFSNADPSRIYSPPSVSSITPLTQKLGLNDDPLHQRNPSRTKTEGSTNLQDIIDAAEAAAESAERAAQAARAAAKLARSRISSKHINNQETVKLLKGGDKHETTSCMTSSELLNNDADRDTILTTVESEEKNEISPLAVKVENSIGGVEEYFGSFDPLVREESREHAMAKIEREEDSPHRRMNVQLRADSYDWTEKSGEEQGFIEEDGIAHMDPLLKDTRNEVERVNSYDWNQIYTKKGDSEEGRASDFVDREEQGITERINTGGDNRHGTVGIVGNPFRVDASISHDSIKSHNSLSGKISPNDLEHDEGKIALPSNESAPIFDVSQQETIQRLPSLEDDPYYTYPNLFLKPSHTSGLS